MSIGGIESYSGDFGAAEASLAAKIGQFGDHCSETLKLLENYEARRLAGTPPSGDDMDAIANEIGVLRDILAERRSEVGNDRGLINLLSQAEVRLRAVELKFQGLQRAPKRSGSSIGEVVYAVFTAQATVASKPRAFKAVHQQEGIDPKLLPFLNVSFDAAYPQINELGDEIADIAHDVFEAVESVKNSGSAQDHAVTQDFVDRLGSRIVAVENTLRKNAVHYPSHISKQLEKQVTGLKSKTNTLEIFRQALYEVTGKQSSQQP